ncbi:MAG TPA: TIGR03936 family radical SAM-associated protein [Lachnospiraceae bacterium]|nr:TIGR03936 family radical SAM-associated protein [Lachnospiraceae bacterium]
MKIRIKFSKHGNVKYIGHLDLQRYFQKAMRRAEIDIAYTTGFSPHQIMSFAAPLGVGLESNGEYMDIEVNSFTGSKDTVDRLNAVQAEGIHILSAKVLPEGAGNAMASVAAAGYSIRFKEGREPVFDWEKTISDFFALQSIPYVKETKKSTIEMNLKDGIYLLECRDHAMNMLIDASSSGNIKPAMVVQAFLAHHHEILQENSLIITREDTYTNVGTREVPDLVPLDAVGTEEE